MVNIVLKLAFVNDVIDFLAYSLNSTIASNLTNNIFIESTLAKCKTLINGLIWISYDIFQFQRSQFSPFLLDGFKCCTWLIIVITHHNAGVGLLHIWWLLRHWVFRVFIRHVQRSLGLHNGRRSMLRFHGEFPRRLKWVLNMWLVAVNRFV